MAKRSKYKPKDFESSKAGSDCSANIYKSMIESEAFKSLTKNQRLLYVYMKMQYYGVATNKHPKQNQEMFYFNKHLWCDKYGLYKNANSFEKDRDSLIEKGFIKCVENGNNTRTKSVYQFSSKWRLYGSNAFYLYNDEMTTSLLHKRAIKEKP